MKKIQAVGMMSGLLAVVLLAGTTMVVRADEKKQPNDKPQAKPAAVEKTLSIRLDVDGEDGKVQTFSIPMPSGQQKTAAIVGKAIIIGPDGKKQEFDLPMNLGEFKIPEILMKAAASPGGYMIGLQCKPVDGEVRKELKLGDAGLEVLAVVEDTPAATAGIEEQDVLVKAGKQNLTKLEDLMAAVQRAGKAEEKLTLQLFHDGKKKTVEVTPVPRQAIEFPMVLPGLEELQKRHPELKQLQKQFEQLKDAEGFQFRFGEIGPAVITPMPKDGGDTDVQALKKQVESLSRQVRELKKAVSELKAAHDH